jgi:hypothetical protein
MNVNKKIGLINGLPGGLTAFFSADSSSRVRLQFVLISVHKLSFLSLGRLSKAIIVPSFVFPEFRALILQMIWVFWCS